MMALVTEFLPYIIAAVTAVAGIIGVYIKGKGAGRQEAEHEQEKIDAEARDRADRARRDAEQSDATDRLRGGDY